MKQLRDERGRFVGSILTWGVELEGGFEGDYEGAADACGWDVDYDESIDTCAASAELVSPVYDKLHLLKHDLKTLYPYIVDANNSMGFHIHIGVPRPVYYLLSSWGFVDFFQQKVGDEFPEVRSRLTNHFCGAWGGPGGSPPNRYGVGPDWPRNHTLQVQAPGKYSQNGNDRYKAINYCYGLHKTIEFRLFPAVNDYHEAFEYLDFVKWAVGEWVSTHDLTPIRWEVEDNMAEDEVIVDLDEPIPEAEPVDLEEHFERTFTGRIESTSDDFDWGPFGTGQTRAELEGRLVYPHTPGCTACDRVRQGFEARILEIHQPAPGAHLNIATHFNEQTGEYDLVSSPDPFAMFDDDDNED